MRSLWTRFGRGRTAPAAPTPEQLRDERLSAYLDDELAAADAAALERELGADAELRAELETLRDVRSALRTLEELRAPRSFALAAPPAPAPRRLIGIELITPLATAAAGLLLVFVLVAPGGERVSPAADGVALLAAPKEAAQAQPALAPTVQPAGRAALAAPAASPEAGVAAAAADADTSEAADAATAATTTEAAAPAPPPALAAERSAAPAEPASGSDRRPAIGLAVLTAVLAVLSLRQWRQRRRADGSRG